MDSSIVSLYTFKFFFKYGAQLYIRAFKFITQGFNPCSYMKDELIMVIRYFYKYLQINTTNTRGATDGPKPPYKWA